MSKRLYAVWWCLAAVTAHAGEVSLDSSGVGDNRVALPEVGNTFTISEDLGQRSGGNLLHTFHTFNIDAGETALFTQGATAPINHVISRVTGGAISTLRGTISVDIAGANFWFVNPAGVVIGNDAQIQVDGSFNVGAADFLVFDDASNLQAIDATPVLAVADPVGFGFLDVNGGVGQLSVGTVAFGSSLDFGDTPVTFSGQEVTLGNGFTPIETASDLTVSGGDVSVESRVTTRADADAAIVFADIENLTLSNSVTSDYTGPDQGASLRFADIGVLRVGDFVLTDLDDPNLIFDVFGFQEAGITALNIGERGAITSSSSGSGSGGDIVFSNVGSLELASGYGEFIETPQTSSIATTASSTATAGSVIISGNGSVNSRLDIRSGVISSGDTLLIQNFETVALRPAPGSNAQVESIGSGVVEISAGDSPTAGLEALVSAANSLTFNSITDLEIDGARVSSSTTSAADAGDVTLSDIANVVVNGVLESNTGFIPNPDGTPLADGVGVGNAGNITVQNVGSVVVTGSGQISSRTQGDADSIGRGGSIQFSNVGVVEIQRSDANVGRISSSSTSLAGNAQGGSVVFDRVGLLRVAGEMNARTLGNASAGNVDLQNVQTLLVSDEGAIRTNTTAPGSAGSVQLSVVNDAALSGLALAAYQSRASQDNLAAGSLVIADTGRIESTSAISDETPLGPGFEDFRSAPEQLGGAGTVSISADAVTLTDFARVSTTTEGGGAAGSLNLSAGRLELQAGTTVESASIGTNSGASGSVNLDGEEILIDGATVRATTQSNVEANTPGQLSITATDQLLLSRALIEASTTGGSKAGNIDITAAALNMDATAIRSSTTAGGDAGTIDVRGDVLALDVSDVGFASEIETNGSDLGGNAGAVTITATQQIVAGDYLLQGLDQERARVSISSRGGLGATGGQAGAVTLSAPSIDVNNLFATVDTDSSRAGNLPAALTVTATDNMRIVDSSLESTTGGSNAAGVLRLQAPAISILRSSVNSGSERFNNPSSDAGSGDAGSIEVTAQSLLFEDTTVSSNTEGAGAGGQIQLLADDIVMLGGQVNTKTLGAGNAGTIEITASGDIEISGAATINSDAILSVLELPDTTLTGDSGDIAITAGGDLRLTVLPSEGVELLSAEISSRSRGRLDGPELIVDATGAAGSVTLSGANVSIDQARLRVSSASSLQNDSGQISVTAGNNLQMTDVTMDSDTLGPSAAGDVNLLAGSGLVIIDGTLTATTSGTGNAGNVSFGAPLISVDRLTLLSNTDAAGNAGSIDIAGQVLELDISDTGLESSIRTNGSDAGGNAGAITIRASESIVSGDYLNSGLDTARARLDISSNGGVGANGGQAGTVTLSAPSIDVNGLFASVETDSSLSGNLPAQLILTAAERFRAVNSTVVSSTGGANAAGSINLQAGDITLLQSTFNSGSEATTDINPDAGSGDAGSVVLSAADGLLLQDTALSSNTAGSGTGGQVTLSGAEVSIAQSLLSTRTLGAGNAGTVAISADRLNVQAGSLQATTQGTGAGGNVIVAAQTIDIGGGTQITASTTSQGSAGNIELRAAAGNEGNGDITIGDEPGSSSFTITSSSRLSPGVAQAGDAGDITIAADGQVDISSNGAGLIASSSDGSGNFSIGNSGRAGSVDISAEHVRINGTLVSTQTAADDVARTSGGGGLSVVAAGQAILTDAQIRSDTLGPVGAGSIRLAAGEAVILDGTGVTNQTVGAGDAGLIDISASEVVLRDGTLVAAQAGQNGEPLLVRDGSGGLSNFTLPDDDSGSAGTINISGTDRVRSNATADGEMLADADPVLISSRSLSATSGSAGDITINGNDIVLRNTDVSVSTQSNALGQAVAVTAGRLKDLTLDTAPPVTISAAGETGSILLNADAGGLQLLDTRLVASTNGAVAAGDIDVRGDSVLIGLNSLVTTETTAAGAGGNINLGSAANPLGTLLINGGAQITATASGAGDSGAVNIVTVNDTTLSSASGENTLISTTSAQSTGGDINADIGGLLTVANSSIETSAAAAGNGGDINIASAALLVTKSTILARANQGNGGAISINVGDPNDPSAAAVFIDSQSLINADSQQGVSGQIDVTNPDTDVNAAITPQEAAIEQDPTLAADICTPRGREQQSSFVVRSNGGVRQMPDAYLDAVAAPEADTQLSGPFQPPTDGQLVSFGGCE